VTTIPNTSITSRALLVDLDVSMWSAHKYDKQVSNEVAQQHQASNDAGRYNKRLLAKEALVEIRQVSGRAHVAHYDMTLPWGKKGERLLVVELHDKYTRMMRQFQRDFEAAVDKFVENYPQYKEDARKANGSLFKEHEYPAISEIRDMFAFGYTEMPVPDAGDVRVALGDIEVERIAAAVEATCNARIEEGIRDCYGRIIGVVERMATSLREYTVTTDGVEHPFRDSLVGNVRDLADLLPALNVMRDSGLDHLTNRVQAELCHYGPKQLRASEADRNEVAAAAESILAQAKEFLG
jgi:hypothetical protein